MIQKYRKRPVVIEAVQYHADNYQECVNFIGAENLNADSSDNGRRIIIKTLEGKMTATPGDFIIKGVRGEFYPCKPDIFEKTYDVAGKLKPFETFQRMMDKDNSKLRMAPLTNIIRMQTTKRGGEIVIGVPESVINDFFAKKSFAGGLLLADQAEYNKIMNAG